MSEVREPCLWPDARGRGSGLPGPRGASVMRGLSPLDLMRNRLRVRRRASGQSGRLRRDPRFRDGRPCRQVFLDGAAGDGEVDVEGGLYQGRRASFPSRSGWPRARHPACAGGGPCHGSACWTSASWTTLCRRQRLGSVRCRTRGGNPGAALRVFHLEETRPGRTRAAENPGERPRLPGPGRRPLYFSTAYTVAMSVCGGG